MNTTDILSESHELLDRIDERFLAAVHALLRTYEKPAIIEEDASDEIIGYSIGGNKPILASEADDAFEAIVEDVKQDNYVEIDDLIAQRSSRW